MNKPWEKFFNLSIVQFMAFPETIRGEGPIAAAIEKIAMDPFWTGIEISWIKDPAVRKQVRGLLETANLPAIFGAQPPLISQRLDLNAAEPDMRKKAVDQIIVCMDMAAEMNIHYLSLISGWDPGADKRAEAKKFLEESVLKICEYGQSQLISVNLEIFDRDYDVHALLGPLEESAVFSARIKRDFPDFGLLYDLSHQAILNQNTRSALTLLKDHLVHVHLGNCTLKHNDPLYGDKHPRIGYTGGAVGVPELTEFISGLFEIGYLEEETDQANKKKPWVGFEVKPMPGESSELLLAGTKRAFIKAWSDL